MQDLAEEPHVMVQGSQPPMTVCSSCRKTTRTISLLARRFACVTRTPRGADVEPDVY